MASNSRTLPGQTLLVPPGTRCADCQGEAGPVAVATGDAGRVRCWKCEQERKGGEAGDHAPGNA
jgi:hypothetical protein